MSCKIVGHMENTPAALKALKEKHAFKTKKRNKVVKTFPLPKGKTNVGNPREKGPKRSEQGAFDPKSKSHQKALRKLARKSKV